MANIRIYNKNNTIYLFGQAYSAGDLTATNPAQDRITITRDSDSKVLVKAVPYTSIKDKDGNNWGSSVSNALTALNNYLGGDNPDKVIVADDKASFTGKSGYTVIVDQTNEQITTSSKLLFTASDIKLGDDLNVQSYSIYSGTTNADIQLTPNGTGSVNLDGTVKFKRFDAGATAPSAFVGGMYANDDDELFFGVTGA